MEIASARIDANESHAIGCRRRADSCRYLGPHFRKYGFAATAVYSGEEAVEAAKMLQPDVLVADVIMPGISGIEAAIRIQEMLPSCKILLLSGFASTEELLKRAQKEGHHFEVVAKPVAPEELIRRLSDMTRQRLGA